MAVGVAVGSGLGIEEGSPPISAAQVKASSSAFFAKAWLDPGDGDTDCWLWPGETVPDGVGCGAGGDEAGVVGVGVPVPGVPLGLGLPLGVPEGVGLAEGEPLADGDGEQLSELLAPEVPGTPLGAVPGLPPYDEG